MKDSSSPINCELKIIKLSSLFINDLVCDIYIALYIYNKYNYRTKLKALT